MSVSNFPLLRLGTADAYVETPWIAMADKNAMSVTILGMSGSGTFTASLIASDDQVGTVVRGNSLPVGTLIPGTALLIGTVVSFGKSASGGLPLTSAWSKVRISPGATGQQGVFQLSINTAID